MSCKAEDISPVFYGVHHFNYSKKNNHYVGIAKTKSQYVYRYLYFTKGNVNMSVDNNNTMCSKNSVLYLSPGVNYRFVSPTEDFGIINLFFDFFPHKGADRGGNDSRCFFIQDVNHTLFSPSVQFSDTRLFDKYHLFENVDCSHLFEKMLSANRNFPYFNLYMKSVITSITSQLLIKETQKNTKTTGNAEKIISYINMNICKDLSPEYLSRKFGYHPNHINYLIKGHTGFSTSDYIRKAKINYAKTLLSETHMSTSQIAAELGYYDYSHFYKAFVCETGKAPGNYKNNLLKLDTYTK